MAIKFYSTVLVKYISTEREALLIWHFKVCFYREWRSRYSQNCAYT